MRPQSSSFPRRRASGIASSKVTERRRPNLRSADAFVDCAAALASENGLSSTPRWSHGPAPMGWCGKHEAAHQHLHIAGPDPVEALLTGRTLATTAVRRRRGSTARAGSGEHPRVFRATPSRSTASGDPPACWRTTVPRTAWGPHPSTMCQPVGCLVRAVEEVDLVAAPADGELSGHHFCARSRASLIVIMIAAAFRKGGWWPVVDQRDRCTIGGLDQEPAAARREH